MEEVRLPDPANFHQLQPGEAEHGRYQAWPDWPTQPKLTQVCPHQRPALTLRTDSFILLTHARGPGQDEYDELMKATCASLEFEPELQDKKLRARMHQRRLSVRQS